MASINHLAEEMIIKILSWLPVLSLLRCKSVCKSWKSIISDPHFIQAHLTTSLNKTPFSLLRVVQRGNYQVLYIDTPNEDSVELTLPVPENWFYDFYVCSCNGLVTLANTRVDGLYIWNPLTRLFKLLPEPTYPRCFNFGFSNELGFGFDSVSNDYKILRVVFGKYSFGSKDHSGIVAELYSVNADTWREIKVPKEMLGVKRFSDCVCVGSGVLYFKGMDEIVSFDLHDEVFGLYQYPKGVGMSEIFDFDGSVALILKSSGGGSVLSLWTLDDVGGNFSWTKKFNIDPDLKIDYLHVYLGDRQFLAHDFGVGYFFYDDRKKGNKKFPPLACVVKDCMSFTGSLVSLEGFKRRE